MKYRIVETIVKDYNGKIVEYKYTIENRNSLNGNQCYSQ